MVQHIPCKIQRAISFVRLRIRKCSTLAPFSVTPMLIIEGSLPRRHHIHADIDAFLIDSVTSTARKYLIHIVIYSGPCKTVRVRLYTDQFGYYTNDGERSWNIAPGKYLLKVGASSEDIRLQTEITLIGKPVRKRIRDNYFSEIM